MKDEVEDYDDDEEFDAPEKWKGAQTFEIVVQLGGVNNVEMSTEIEVDMTDITRARLKLRRTAEMMVDVIPAVQLRDLDSDYRKKVPNVAINNAGELVFLDDDLHDKLKSKKRKD